MGPSLVQAVLGLVAFAVVEATLLVTGPVEPTWVVLAFPAMGLLYGAAGVVAWTRRPRNRTGALLVFGAWTWMVAGLANVGNELLVAFGQLGATLPFAVIVHLVLAFPSGRLPDRVSRATVAGAYLATTVFEAPRWMFVAAAPAEPLLVRLDPGMDLLAQLAQGVVALVVVLTSTALVVRNLRAARPSTRRGAAPLLVYGLVTVVVVPLSASVIQPVFDIDPLRRVIAQLVVMAVVPVAFAVAVLRGGFARVAELDQVATWLATDRPPVLRDVLVDALGDPSVELALWVADAERYVDEEGRLLPDGPREGQEQVEIALGGRRVGVLRYDPQAVHDPDLVTGAGRVLALALDRRRLDVELVSANAELRESRARLVAAADRERRRIATDLHDGAQGRLVVLAIRAQRVLDGITAGDAERARGDAVEVRDGLLVAVDEMRALVQGVMPTLLLEAGLTAATLDLVERMPIPTVLDADEGLRSLPTPVETTAYLVVAESLANALKHAGAGRVEVRLRDGGDVLRVEVHDDGVGGAATAAGSGLRSLADRVNALGGRLTVHSPAGEGTLVAVEVPCGS